METCFMDVVARWQGRVHGARIFQNFPLNKILKVGSMPPSKKFIVENCDPVPAFLLGDPADSRLP